MTSRDEEIYEGDAHVGRAQKRVVVKSVKRNKYPARLFVGELLYRGIRCYVIVTPMDHQDPCLPTELAELIDGIVATHDFPQGRC